MGGVYGRVFKGSYGVASKIIAFVATGFNTIKEDKDIMTRRRFFIIWFLLTTFATTLLFSGYAVAEENQDGLSSDMAIAETPYPAGQETDKEKGMGEKMTMFHLIMKGGVVGGLIILLSCIGLGLIIDYALTIRKEKLAPQEHITAFKKLIAERKIEDIMKMADENPSFLSNVMTAGLNEIHLGYQSMIKAMEDTAEALSARLARKIEHLNVIGNISPMLGLLGTVTGMLRCFNEISQVAGAIDPKQLAGGIFEALVTTCLGLIVAIPTIYFYAIFRNRIDELTGEASLAAEEIITAYKEKTVLKER